MSQVHGWTRPTQRRRDDQFCFFPRGFQRLKLGIAKTCKNKKYPGGPSIGKTNTPRACAYFAVTNRTLPAPDSRGLVGNDSTIQNMNVAFRRPFIEMT